MNPAQERLHYCQKVSQGEMSVAQACRLMGISRVTFYKWLNRFNSGSELGNKRPIFESRRIEVPHQVTSLVLKLIATHPRWGRKEIADKAGLIMEKKISDSLVYRIMKENELSNNDLRKKKKGTRGVSLEEERQVMCAMFGEGKMKVAAICRRFGISRVTFYKWFNRWKEESTLCDRVPKFDRSDLRVSKDNEKQIIKLALNEPNLGKYGISKRLGIGPSGIYNVLLRNNLNRYENRISQHKNMVVNTDMVSPLPILDQIHSVLPAFTPQLAPAPPPFSFFSWLSSLTLGLGLGGGVGLGFWVYARLVLSEASFTGRVGISFAVLALVCGMMFFLYSSKYYISIGLVLSFSQAGLGISAGKLNLKRLLGMGGNQEAGLTDMDMSNLGMKADLSSVTLSSYPHVSVHIPFYNEKNVVERAVAAAIAFDWPEYEVILADDSTDETTQIIWNYMLRIGRVETVYPIHSIHSMPSVGDLGYTVMQVEVRPGLVLKHIHRTSRQGYKGGALALALQYTNPNAQYVSIFDADFVPYPDSLISFAKYFELARSQNTPESAKIAVVQGYQWHVLNKSENWITRGVRTEYSGSYVIERAAGEVYGGLKQISGSVYMIKKEVLTEIGWGTSITEDFELTLRLYEKGYKVLYTPYIQAPAECVSTLKRLVRQRMRWAEGHSHNVKLMWKRLLFNNQLTRTEKLEFAYLAPYYLQAAVFILGTFCWLVSETVFKTTLPFWTALWGWSLVISNLIALPLMNGVGIFLEEGEERDYVGLVSFIALSYLVVPFQAYAAIKGFLEKEEGPWFRTPKTGKITDIFRRSVLGRFLRRLVLGGGVLPVHMMSLPLKIPVVSKSRSRKYMRVVVAVMLIISSLIHYFALVNPMGVLAAAPNPTIEQQINIIDQQATSTSTTYTPTDNSLGLFNWDSSKYSGTLTLRFEADLSGSGTNNVGAYSRIYCITAANCKVAYYDASNGNLNFMDCFDSTCSSGIVSVVDGGTGCGLTNCSTSSDRGKSISMYCPASDDCKIAYANSTDLSLMFADCDTETCSTGTVSLLDGQSGCVITGCSTSDTINDFNSIVCLTAGDCKIASKRSADVYFYDCDSATCGSGTTTLVDGDTGCSLTGCIIEDLGSYLAMYCVSATDCKIAYRENTNSALIFADCDSATCGSGNVTILDGKTSCVITGCDTSFDTGWYPGIYCPATDNCKITYLEDTNDDVRFIDCGTATCSTGASVVLDGNTGCTLSGCSTTNNVGSFTNIYCVSSTDCKVIYRDRTNGDLRFGDCDDEGCTSGTNTLLDGSSGCVLTNCETTVNTGHDSSIYCLTGSACQISYSDVSTSALFFGTCSTATCSSGTRITPDAGGVVSVGLYSSSGTQVNCASGTPSVVEVSTGSASIIRQTTGLNNSCAFTTNEIADGDYTIRFKTTAGDTAIVKGARLRIIQTNPTLISKTLTQIEVGNSQTSTSLSSIRLTDFKSYRWDSSKFSGTPAVYFEATIKNSNASRITSAELSAVSDCSTVVTGSSVTVTGTTWSRSRSSDIFANLTTGTDYWVCIHVNIASTASIANAKIIVEQSNVGGITDFETVQQGVNTLATDADSTYTSQNFSNQFDPDNFYGGSFVYLYEATLKTSAGTGYSQLYDQTAGSAISGSEVSTTSTSYSRQRSSSLTMPASAANMDTQIKNSSTNTTSVSNSWLIIQVSGLQVPENVWLLIPIVIFIPVIIKRWRMSRIPQN